MLLSASQRYLIQVTVKFESVLDVLSSKGTIISRIRLKHTKQEIKE